MMLLYSMSGLGLLVFIIGLLSGVSQAVLSGAIAAVGVGAIAYGAGSLVKGYSRTHHECKSCGKIWETTSS